MCSALVLLDERLVHAAEKDCVLPRRGEDGLAPNRIPLLGHRARATEFGIRRFVDFSDLGL